MEKRWDIFTTDAMCEGNIGRGNACESSRIPGEYIGSSTEQRINQIIAGMGFLQRMTGYRQAGEQSHEE